MLRINLDEVKIALENWLTAGGSQQYYYDRDWKVLIGFPAAHGSNYALNDQHFHHGYAILAAATVANMIAHGRHKIIGYDQFTDKKCEQLG